MLNAGINTMATAGLVALLTSCAVTAEEWGPDLSSDSGNFAIKILDDFQEARKYSSAFRIRGIGLGKNAYLDERKVTGRKGPGLAAKHGKLTWGFTHRGAEIKLQF